jgi:tRNA A-37 threonylcarbamoyl transferase component Bud32
MSIRESSWISVREGNLRGVINPGLRPVLKAGFLDDLSHQAAVRGGRVIKDSRIHCAATFPVEEGKTIFIKQFRILGGLKGFKYLIRPSQAMREWLISRFLSQKGILTPKALGMLERGKHGVLKESFFVAEALEEARDLLEFCKIRFHGSDQMEEKNQILRLLAKTIRKIHDSGLFHKDFHGGNFLIADKGPLSLYLVDFHQARRQLRVSRAKRLWNIAQIFSVLDFMLDNEAKKLFLLTYCQGWTFSGRTLDRCLGRVERMVQKIVNGHHKRRAKKCLKESTLFTIERRADLKIYRRREMEENDLMMVLEARREMVHSQREKVLKYSPESFVSIIMDIAANDRRVCIKEYRYETILDRLRNSFKRPKGKSSWVVGNVLFSRGMCLLKPLAYIERRKLGLLRKALFVTESLVGDMEMGHYLTRRFERKARQDLGRFMGQFTGWIGSLHRAGIYHRDLKTSNILVRERPDGWGFSLIDLEDVLQEPKIGNERILRNLVQINCSVPRFLSYGDRIRFLRGYLRANPLTISGKVLIKKVLEESPGGK